MYAPSLIELLNYEISPNLNEKISLTIWSGSRKPGNKESFTNNSRDRDTKDLISNLQVEGVKTVFIRQRYKPSSILKLLLHTLNFRQVQKSDRINSDRQSESDRPGSTRINLTLRSSESEMELHVSWLLLVPRSEYPKVLIFQWLGKWKTNYIKKWNEVKLCNASPSQLGMNPHFWSYPIASWFLNHHILPSLSVCCTAP